MPRVHTRGDAGAICFNMVYVVYILKNPNDKYYIGYTGDINRRLEKHNLGHTKSTKNKGVWKIAYKEQFETRGQAIKREKYIKKQKSKKFIEELIHRGVEK